MSSFEKRPVEKNLKRSHIGQFLFFIVSVFSLIFVIMSFLTLFGSSFLYLELMTHLRVQLLLPLLVVVPVLVLMRSRVVLALVAVAIFIHLFDIFPLYLPRASQSPVATLRVLSINLNTSNKNFTGVRKLIEKEDADLVCLQELTPAMCDSLVANLSGYRYRFLDAREGYFGIGVFSKYDLLDMKKLKLCADDIPTLSASIELHGTKIRVINTHPIAPINELFYTWRNEQLDSLADLTAQSVKPVIVVGDLNMSYFSPFFKRLLSRGKLSDSEFGNGIQQSWSAQMWPLHAPFDCVLFRLPLDHVLFKGPIVTLDRKVLEGVGSDHFPLSVKLGLTAERKGK